MSVYDLIIIGAGPVGTALAMQLAPHYRVLILEAQSGTPRLDPRVLALSARTKKILMRLGVWSVLEPQAVTRVEMSAQGVGVPVFLTAKNTGEAVGYAVALGALQQAFSAGLAQIACDQHRPAFFQGIEKNAQGLWQVIYEYAGQPQQACATMVVGADGPSSPLRACFPNVRCVSAGTKVSLVTRLQFEGPGVAACAYQRLSARGILALLPDRQGATFVITGSVAQIAAWEAATLDQWLEWFDQIWGQSFGRVVAQSPFQRFEVQASFMPQPVHETVVWVGAAAQQLWPIAAQGLNLNFRTADYLAQCLLQKGLNTAALTAYVQGVQQDRQTTWDRILQLDRWSARYQQSPDLVGLGLFGVALAPGLQAIWRDWGMGMGV